jgi:hypothetical protein
VEEGYRILMGKSFAKRSVGKERRRQEENTKMALRELIF